MSIIINQKTSDIIYIIDKDVMNKADGKEAQEMLTLLKEGQNLGNRKVLYQDRSGIIDEIFHDNGVFVGFMSDKTKKNIYKTKP